MPAKFNADEIFTIAVDIEKNGEKFYRRAAELATDDDSKTLLTNLADWEESHIRIFSELHAELKDLSDDSFSWDPYGEVEKYLQSVADGQVFTSEWDITKAAEDCSSIWEILEFALGREKDAVVFYTSVDMIVPDDIVGEKIDAIVREEISHVRLLTEKLRKLG